eukprot:5112623-Amphidinium_carterae.1
MPSGGTMRPRQFGPNNRTFFSWAACTTSFSCSAESPAAKMIAARVPTAAISWMILKMVGAGVHSTARSGTHGKLVYSGYDSTPHTDLFVLVMGRTAPL